MTRVMFWAVIIVGFGFSIGCTQNSQLVPGVGQQFPTAPAPGMATAPSMVTGAPPADYQARVTDLERRLRHLDDNNRQLHTQLAQAEQQIQFHKNQADVMREQLAELTGTVKDAHMAAADAQQKFLGLQASNRFRGGATITPNTNLRQSASRLSLGGLPVRYENDSIRILVPSDQLFQHNSGQLLGTASSILDPIAHAIQSNFPKQKIGIEGYTDDQQIYGGAYGSKHQLSAAQTSSVFEQFTRRNGLPSQQLFTLAQGPNYPRGDNATAVGRASNRRIEIVVYPQTY